MSDLVAIAYPDVDTARQVTENMVQLQKAHELDLEDLFFQLTTGEFSAEQMGPAQQ